MSLLQLSIGLFALAALLGLYLLILVLSGKETRKGVALIHGPVAAAALVLLIIFSIRNKEEGHFAAIGLFVLAAAGGLVLFYRDITGHQPPKWLAILHGLIAVIAFLLVLIG